MKSLSNKRILVTGGAGFIGSHLVEILLERGYYVTIIDDLSTGSFENIAHMTKNPRFRYAIDSIMNDIILDRLASECQVIFHLAAAVGVKLIVENPVHTIETNIMGTEAVFKAALRYRSKVIVASTSEVYGKGSSIPFREDDDVVLGPTRISRWAYAVSKMVDESLAFSYYREKGLQVVICRLFNTVGPRQTGRYGMVIPRFVHQAIHGQPVTVYGDGEQSRSFCDVADVVQALIGLAECPEAVGQVFNVGSTQEITILELAHNVLSLVESTSIEKDSNKMKKRKRKGSLNALTSTIMNPVNERIIFIPYEEAYEASFEDMQRRVPDITKIRNVIGWKPKISLSETIRNVIQSFQSNANLK